MQNITPTLTTRAPIIQSYGPAGFRISGVDYASSVLVTADTVIPLTIRTLDHITPDLFLPVAESQPPIEILLIGTGASHALLSSDLRAVLKAKGFNPDAMTTGAACRTFTILVSEERRVAALLLLPL
ncbi:MAG: hypothetical protein B7X02_02590 [Rhodospirillales bacterium 12-54-5]|nr:MAG: hypothetical protein B7X02_02590 [Rhodospirillales bacterium 12-54-5]